MLTTRNCELAVIIALFAYFMFSPRLVGIPLCPSAYFSGTPCPTCGTTRSVWHIFHGHFHQAWAFNPLGFLVVVILIRRVAVLSFNDHPIGRFLNSERIGILLFTTFLLIGLLRMLDVFSVRLLRLVDRPLGRWA
jgi:hypothetical protein